MQTTKIRDFIIILVSIFVTQIGGECKFESTARERLILRMHNELRRLHDGTADLCYGVSDETHAFTSTEWSKRMLHEAYSDVSQVSHSKNPNTGENLFYMRNPDSVEGSYLDAINVWYSEVRHWKINTEGGERGTFDNFAQIVRNPAREVQCGHKLSIRYGIFITCQYYPRWGMGGPQIGALGLGMDMGIGKVYLKDETQSAKWNEVGVEILEDTPEKETEHEIYAKVINQEPSPGSTGKLKPIINAKPEVKANQLKIGGTENALNVTNTKQQQDVSKETASDREKASKTDTVDEMSAAQNATVTKNSTVADMTNKDSEEENQAMTVDYQQNKQVNDGNNSKASIGHTNKPDNNTMQVQNVTVEGRNISKDAVSVGEGKNSTEIISQDHAERNNGTIESRQATNAKGSENNKTTTKDFSTEEEMSTTQNDKSAESKVNDSTSGNSKSGENVNTVKNTGDLCYGLSDDTHVYTSRTWSIVALHEGGKKDSENPEVGESVFYSSHTADYSLDYILTTYLAVIQEWYNEIEFWDFDKKERIGQKMVGHFTQIVWNETREVHCGYERDPTKGIFITCQYYPKGNIPGKSTEEVMPLKKPATEIRKTIKQRILRKCEPKPKVEKKMSDESSSNKTVTQSRKRPEHMTETTVVIGERKIFGCFCCALVATLALFGLIVLVIVWSYRRSHPGYSQIEHEMPQFPHPMD